MTGFKSFPEKTQMQMNGSITGVVGPNGSGKSNVADAVRWVLGEQSAKSLRGSVMQDVIFSGTEKRKPRAYCEVSLIFDNSEGRLGAEFTEIEIRRKLYQSGESEYYINGSKCRLKDILELFRDTGIGKEGYSIIGQGRIDEILSEKAIERRKVFEEASGIMKYRVRKEESERKLEKTGLNLLRIEDILLEQSLQIKPLKRQAENAQVYLELSEKLKHLEVNLFLYNYDKFKQRIQKLEEAKRSLFEDKEEKEKLLKNYADKHFSEQQSARQIEQKGDELAEELSRALAKIEHIDGEVKLCEERELNLVKDSDRLRLEIDELDTKIMACEEELKADKRRILQIEGELKKHRDTATEAGKTVSELSGVYEDRVKTIEAVQGEKVETIEKISAVKSVLSALNEKRLSTAEKQREFAAEIKEQKELAAKTALEHEGLKDGLDKSHKEQEKALSAFNEKVYLLNGQKEKTLKLKEEYDALGRDYASFVSSAKVISDLKDSFEGYSFGVKQLMTAARQDSSISGRIIGTFADIISVPGDYETAIEMCLGAALQDVVTNTQDDAKFIIKYLRRNKLGRVTFLPLDALKARTFGSAEKAELNAAGILGIASDLISCKRGCEKACEFLLGRTVIVQDNDTAAAIIKSCSFNVRAVSLDGDVFYPGGSITGGSVNKNASGFVSRERRKEELEERAQKLKSRLKELGQSAEISTKAEQQLASEIEEARKYLSDLSIETTKVKERLSALKASEQETQLRIQKLELSSQQNSQNAQSLDEEVKRTADLIDNMQSSSETKSDEIKRTEEAYNKNTQVIEEAKAKVHEAEIKMAELMHENSVLLSQLMRLDEEINDAQKSKAVKKKTIELNSESIENLNQLKNGLKQLKDEKSEIFENIKQQQGSLIEERSKLSQTLSDHDKKMAAIRQEHSDITEKAMRIDFSLEKAHTDIKASQNRLWEMHQLTYANALPMREESLDISKAESEVESMRQRIRYLGNVNPNAIEDYAELKERMETLEEQKNDLIKADEDLRKLIVSLLKDMRKTFKDSFERINKHFNKAFSDLFDGGKAELVLEEGVDIMEAGIEIVAQPPGKKLQKLSLLSGGEKALTAISLLFALLKINPSPVCILDEIDAALDEANVYKFSDYLKKYALNMQFIVITHRQPTMVICDSLFGFAMEEKGVSKLLSVRLE